jgi:tricorn protease
VPIDGGSATKLPIPHASKAAISPDGQTIAYVPLQEQFRQWKHYRGGSTARILLFDVATHEVEQIPQPHAPSATAHCPETGPGPEAITDSD